MTHNLFCLNEEMCRGRNALLYVASPITHVDRLLDKKVTIDSVKYSFQLSSLHHFMSKSGEFNEYKVYYNRSGNNIQLSATKCTVLLIGNPVFHGFLTELTSKFQYIWYMKKVFVKSVK